MPPGSSRNIGVARFDASSRARINGKLFGDPGVPSDSLTAPTRPACSRTCRTSLPRRTGVANRRRGTTAAGTLPGERVAATVPPVVVAFVLSGGASLGAVEVGMLAALRERGIRPDLIVGTSVGALNAAWLAGHPGAPMDDLAEVWTGLHRSDVFPADPRRGLLALAGRRPSLFDEAPLRS